MGLCIFNVHSQWYVISIQYSWACVYLMSTVNGMLSVLSTLCFLFSDNFQGGVLVVNSVHPQACTTTRVYIIINMVILLMMMPLTSCKYNCVILLILVSNISKINLKWINLEFCILQPVHTLLWCYTDLSPYRLDSSMLKSSFLGNISLWEDGGGPEKDQELCVVSGLGLRW